jgi:hypothetical protein
LKITVLSYSFQDKTIADFVEIKKLKESCKVLEKTMPNLRKQLYANENNGIDLKSFLEERSRII